MLEGFDALSVFAEAFFQGFEADLQRDRIPVFEAVHDGSVRVGDPNGVPCDLVGTAYFAHSTDLMARIAGVLGRTKDRIRFRKLHAQIVEAFSLRWTDIEEYPRLCLIRIP
jgi:hypothetical protein